jgi:hypothetical protein
MQLSAQEAAAALADVERARGTMRQAIRAHRGHWHLWIWGVVWMAMPLLAHFQGDGAARYFFAFVIVGSLLSTWVGRSQSQRVRMPVNLRFVGVIASLVIFAAMFPFVLHARADAKSLYAYTCLISMQAYVIAGLWTDSYLLWLGLAITALVLLGFFAFPGIFWLWMAIFGGGALVGTGFYIRHFWR